MSNPHRIKAMITGPQASGKSTAMRVMATALRKHGFDVCVCECGEVMEPFKKVPTPGSFRIVLDTRLTE